MIKSLKRVSLAVPALVVAFTALAAVPVYARGGDTPVSATAGTTTELQSGSSKTEVTASTTTSDSTTAETVATSGRGSDSMEISELRTQAREHITELKKENKSTRTDAERTKVCEAHKEGLTTKFTVIARNSDSFQTRINDVYTKALAYQTSKNISTTDIAALITAADSAKQASAASITSLQAVTPKVDCNNVSVAQDVATFKAAAAQTRTNLKVYKAAVKAVLQALKAATDTTTTKTTGSN